ncbi:Uncharacterized protein TCM_044636 [Theobroma cacao]|uniref:Disease resistance protein At4g27190-like leucine-rich repeats domain-containing protein n=1 Tax=Theobroma cacao TaxID=3641 RepID=A0A061FS71_THECC|nr:Uncharacterized protein TCM_044636 [Theobroma cacao]
MHKLKCVLSLEFKKLFSLHSEELYLSDLGNDKGCDTINFPLKQNLVNLEYVIVGNCVKIFQIQAGHFFSRVELIQLKHLYQLQGPIEVASLQCLKGLCVSECSRLKFLLSPMLARNLPQLINLVVEYCKELEEIIDMDQTSASSSQGYLQPISFPNLKYIQIQEYSNLKSLFPLVSPILFQNSKTSQFMGLLNLS